MERHGEDLFDSEKIFGGDALKKFAFIKNLAIYLPEKIETNEKYDPRFIEKLGINQRHIVSEGESSSDIAIRAAEKIDLSGVDFLLLCTQYPDYIVPSTACILQDRLKLPKSTGALEFSLGCSGYVYGLSLAKSLIESGLATRILFLTSDITSRIVNPCDKTIRPLFGDAATATLIAAEESETPGLDSFVFGSDGSGFDKLIVPAGGFRNESRLTEEIFETDERDNVRSNFDLHMDGNAITYFSLRIAPKMVDEILEKSNLTREQIDHFIFHQVNSFMLDHIRKKCGLENRPFYSDIRDVGNTVSGTIPIGISRVLDEKSPRELNRVMLMGFGVGLSWAGCIANLSHMNF